MKKLILFAGFLLLSVCVYAQQPPDQSTPKATLESLFKMARTQDYTYIHYLCDPEKEGDGDVKRLCNLQQESKTSKEEIYLNMRLAYVLGDIKQRQNMARVPFVFGIKCNEQEEMRLVKRGDKWYLHSF